MPGFVAAPAIAILMRRWVDVILEIEVVVVRFAAIAMAGLLLASLAAQADGGLAPVSWPLDQLEGDVQVWGWNIAAASLNKLVPAFNERYPGVNVHVNMTGANLQSRFLLSLSAGVGAPEVSQLQLAEAARYARTLKMTDLTAVAQQYADDFPASFWSNCVYEGRVYAVPWDMGPCAVFYKRHVFEKYAVDPESIVTWDDFIAAGQGILEASGGETKMMNLSTGGMEVLFEILLQQCEGGQIFDGEGRIAIRADATARVIDLLRKLLQSGITSNNTAFGHAFYASIRSDIIATFPMAAWFGGTIKDYAPEMAGDWGVFRLPAMEPGGLRTSNQGGSVLVIPDQCPRKEAAWAFVEYALCTPEAQIEQYRNFDLFPALLSTHTDPFFDEPDPYYGDQKVRRLFATDIERIPALNRTQDWFEALRYVRQALSEWATNGLGPTEDLLDALESKLARRLGREIAPAG